MIWKLRTALKRAILKGLHEADGRRRARSDAPDTARSPHLWGVKVSDAGHLVIGGCDVVELAERFGTPLHVVDHASLIDRFALLKEAFRRRYPRTEIGCSYKTNPLPSVLHALHEQGALAEVISHFELWLALRLGLPGQRIIFNGPGKTEEALELAVRNRIKLINIDNISEGETIQRFAEANDCEQTVGIRLATSVGWAGQFGFPISSGAALDAFRRLQGLDRLVPCAVHIHLGTGIKEVQPYQRALTEVLAFMRVVKHELGIEMRYVDIGGGFGVPTVWPFSETDTRLMANGYPPTFRDIRNQASADAFAEGITNLLRRHYASEGGEPPELILEPGRALTSSSQLLLLKVLAIKPPGEALNMVILDGGKNVAMPTGYEYHEVFAASKLNEASETTYKLYGPLCHPGDILFWHKRLPKLSPGDVVAVMDAGAYFIPNQMNFSNPRPAAVMVSDGRAQVIRTRETFEHIISLDRAS